MAPQEQPHPKPIPRAVALGYDPAVNTAPYVIAAGQGDLARKILELAEAHGISLVEDAPLAQALVRLQSGQEIPPELYKAVAEILAFVYRLKGRTNVG